MTDSTPASEAYGDAEIEAAVDAAIHHISYFGWPEASRRAYAKSIVTAALSAIPQRPADREGKNLRDAAADALWALDNINAMLPAGWESTLSDPRPALRLALAASPPAPAAPEAPAGEGDVREELRAELKRANDMIQIQAEVETDLSNRLERADELRTALHDLVMLHAQDEIGCVPAPSREAWRKAWAAAEELVRVEND